MTKRALAVVMSALLLFGTAPEASAATAKAGAKCTKLKATSIVNGKKYTCIKSGKNLIWDKGVVVKPVVKASPSAKSGPAPIICPKEDMADSAGITQSRANSLIGMTEVQGDECAQKLNWGFRVGQRDQEFYPMTLDYRMDRVTITVMLGVITRVDVG